MIIHPAELKEDNGRCRVSALVELETPGKVFSESGSSSIELWVDWPAHYYSPDRAQASAFALICLPAAMCLNERLYVSDPIPQALIVNMLEAMAIYQMYFPALCQVIDVQAKGRTSTQTDAQRVGSFYSGGVDSLYNIAEHLRLKTTYDVNPVTDLWLVQGMDIKLSDEELWSETKARLQQPLEGSEDYRYVDIRTNARDIHDKFVGYEVLGFSAILGGISKCFAPIVGTSLIGSYATYDDIIPHSSSPLVDPMWSCDQQIVRHFSCRASRIDKIATIGEHAPHLLKNLRVCYLNDGGAYNCGKCEKCLRTQMQLMLCGCLDKCDTFDTTLSPESLNKLRLPWHKKNMYTWDFWRDIEAACAQAGYTDFQEAIRLQLLRNRIGWTRRKARTMLGRLLGRST